MKVVTVVLLSKMISTLLVVLALTFLFIYYVSRRKFDYWEKKNIPHIKPWPFLGNYGEFITLKTYSGIVAQSICQKFPNAPYIGAYFGTEPALLVQDPEVIKLVTTKDFYYFNGREISNYTHKEVFTQNLFFTYGDRWKVMRQNLTPLFSSAKMKNMFHLIENCAHVFEKMIDTEINKSDVLELKNLFERFAMDCIGACAFGVDMNAMEENWEENLFKTMGNELLLPTKYRGFLLVARSIWPAIFYGLGMKSFPLEVDRFFHNVMTKVFAGRNYKPTTRNDFVDLILSLKKEQYITGDSIDNFKDKNEKIRLKVDDDFLVAQCLVFFAAGFETSSGTMQFTLFELAKNEQAQNRAIEEVDQYLQRHNNKLVYECITELPFVDACIDEALRLYPVLGIITREVMKDYTLPCGTVLDKGVRIHLPVYHLHHHPDFFPDPEQYRPERFLGEEKVKIKQHTYIPFGDGPRICIGMRFARMQMMAGLITILKKYRVVLAKDTPPTPEFGAITLAIRTKEDIKLQFIEREGWEQRLLKS